MKTSYEVLLNALTSLGPEAATTNKIQLAKNQISFGGDKRVTFYFSPDGVLKRIELASESEVSYFTVSSAAQK